MVKNYFFSAFRRGEVAPRQRKYRLVYVVIALSLFPARLFAVETRDEWIEQRQPVRYLLIKAGQEPQDLGVCKSASGERLEGMAIDEATYAWHTNIQTHFWDVASRTFQEGVTLGDSSSTNCVKIRIVARYEGGETRELPLPPVFLSGGRFDPSNKPLVALADAFGGPHRIRLMDDVFQSTKSGSEKGREYKESLGRFFGLQPLAGSSEAKEATPRPAEAEGPFDFNSNLRTLKYFKQSADTLFQDGHFIYEFYDSEQVARSFMINKAQEGRHTTDSLEISGKRLRSLHQLASNDSLDPTDPVHILLQSELRKEGMVSEDLQINWGQLFPPLDGGASGGGSAEERYQFLLTHLVGTLRSLKEIKIDLATHGHMCHSCQGTYWYELERGHELERDILWALCNEAAQTLADSAPLPSESQSGGGKRKARALNCLDELTRKIRDTQKCKDPRAQFFPACQFSVLVSSTKTKSKESRVSVPLSALLAENTRTPAPEEWWISK